MSPLKSDHRHAYRQTVDALSQAIQASLSGLEDGGEACFEATRHFCSTPTATRWQTQEKPDASPWVDQAEAALTLARQLYLAGMRVQGAWLLAGERLAALSHAQVLSGLEQAGKRTPEPHQPAMQAMQAAVTVSGSACDALSKATRQVSQFAGTNLTAATLRAFTQAREQFTG